MKETILITGGSGVIGSKVLPLLLETYKVICLGKRYESFSEEIRHHKNFKFYERDFAKIHSEEQFLIPEKIDIILHMAAVVSGSRLSKELYDQINVKSTKHLIDFAKNKQIKRFCFLSSVSVYGGKQYPIHINSERLGTSLYAKTKKEAEDILISSGLPYSILRLASVYGKGTKSYIHKLTALAKKRLYPKLRSDRRKSLVHWEDVVHFINLFVDKSFRNETLEPIYILSEPNSYSTTDVLQILREKQIAKGFIFTVPIDGHWGAGIDSLLRFLNYVRKRPNHNSPLDPIRESIELFDENSWKKMGIFPKWNLRKAFEEVQ